MFARPHLSFIKICFLKVGICCLCWKESPANRPFGRLVSCPFSSGLGKYNLFFLIQKSQRCTLCFIKSIFSEQHCFFWSFSLLMNVSATFSTKSESKPIWQTGIAWYFSKFLPHFLLLMSNFVLCYSIRNSSFR